MMHLLGFGSAEVGVAPQTNSKIKPRPHQGSNDRLGNWGSPDYESGGSGVRISPGAPPSTHLRTPAWPILVCKNGLLKKVLASLYTDMVVIDFNDIDERLKVSLAEGHRAGAEILAHGAAEIFDQRRIDPDLRGQVLLGPPKLLWRGPDLL